MKSKIFRAVLAAVLMVLIFIPGALAQESSVTSARERRGIGIGDPVVDLMFGRLSNGCFTAPLSIFTALCSLCSMPCSSCCCPCCLPCTLFSDLYRCISLSCGLF